MDPEHPGDSLQIQSTLPPTGQVLRIALGARHYALRSSELTRVLPMCAWTPLHGSEGPLGLLEIAGILHPVMDPRPRLGLETVDIALEHHLLLIAAQDSQPAFVLWVDRVEAVFEVSSGEVQRLEVFEGSPVRFLVRHQGETLPLLECAYFSPGEFVRPA